MAHLQLSFTARLCAIAKISAAFKHALPEASPTEIKEKARLVEENASRVSFSFEEYCARWHESISELQLSPVARPKASRDPGIETPPLSPSSLDQQLGSYSAQPHRHGLFSTIFRTQSPETHKQLALKLTHHSQISPPHDSRREARLLRLASHSTVLPLLETFSQPDGGFVLVFPFLSLTLEEALLQPHMLSVSSIRSHLRSLFDALAHIHSLGMIHRDIKPSNILLTSPFGSAYLADFGIAWQSADEASEPMEDKITDVGTTAYRPPELLFGYREYGCELDLWAAGCVVAECFSGRRTTLFDPGPLGSELGLIQSIFKTLGTPTETIWPGVTKFPDWGKISFYEYAPEPWSKILPTATQETRDLVDGLVRYEGSERLTAAEALNHQALFERASV